MVASCTVGACFFTSRHLLARSQQCARGAFEFSLMLVRPLHVAVVVAHKEGGAATQGGR